MQLAGSPKRQGERSGIDMKNQYHLTASHGRRPVIAISNVSSARKQLASAGGTMEIFYASPHAASRVQDVRGFDSVQSRSPMAIAPNPPGDQEHPTPGHATAAEGSTNIGTEERSIGQL
jgi:hypothetical protein